jgi:hypothetical protein
MLKLQRKGVLILSSIASLVIGAMFVVDWTDARVLNTPHIPHEERPFGQIRTTDVIRFESEWLKAEYLLPGSLGNTKVVNIKVAKVEPERVKVEADEDEKEKRVASMPAKKLYSYKRVKYWKRGRLRYRYLRVKNVDPSEEVASTVNERAVIEGYRKRNPALAPANSFTEAESGSVRLF